MILVEGTRLRSYEIRSLIGKGGMGEVYLAFDRKLRRQVALKVLSKKDSNPERLQRFKQEAISASSLNHPNIVTVYDFGQTRDIYYIVTEYIEGITLRKRLQKGISIAESLDIAIQIGKALSAAHSTGIIHRDIKPENVMLLPKEFLKVLDFGLAKLSNPPEILSNELNESTVSVFETQRGLLIGTISYMSPEQLCQQKVDERADIWSLGIILFEMITGRRPFEGSSTSEIIASILKQPLLFPDDFSLNFNPQLEAAIAAALAKEKEKRFQKIEDFVAVLTEIRQAPNRESGSKLINSGTDNFIDNSAATKENRSDTITQASEIIQPGFLRISRWWLTGLGIVMLSGLSFWFYNFYSIGQTRSSVAPLNYESRLLSDAGNIIKAAISPDGRNAAYVVEMADGSQSLKVGQLDFLASASRELNPPSKIKYAGLTFSTDGNYIYYYSFGVDDSKSDENTTGVLYRRLYLSDTQSAQEILRDIDSPVTFSPDGSKFAYIQADWKEKRDKLIIATADGSEKDILLERKYPDFIATKDARESPVWSPDGEFIACPVGSKDQNNDSMSVVKVDLKTRREFQITAQKWKRVGRIVWINNGEEMLLTTADYSSDLYQIVRLSVKTGETQPFTKDFSDYTELSVTPDSKKLVAIQSERKSSLWIAQSNKIGLPERLTGNKYDALWGGTWTADGKLIYSSFENGARDLWTLGIDDKSRQQLTFDPEINDYPAVSPDGKYIVFVSNHSDSAAGNAVSHIWRTNVNGTDLKQLTVGEGEFFPQITADGKWVVYVAGTGLKTLWKTPLEGGEEIHLTEVLAHWVNVSPDGKMAACLTIKEGEQQFRLGIFSVETGVLLKDFTVQMGIASPSAPAVIRWMPDGKSIIYVITKGNVSNLWEQSLSGGDPKLLTDFTSDIIFWCDWSKDGKQLALSRGMVNSNMVSFWKF